MISLVFTVLTSFGSVADFSEEQIWQYTDTGYHPQGAYTETLGDYDSIYMENTVSTRPQGERDKWLDLCANSAEEAKQYSKLSNQYSSQEREFGEARETSLYYENKMVDRSGRYGLLSRVFKCDFFDGAAYDRLSPQSVRGHLKAERSIENSKKLIEYLWFYNNYNIGGHVLLKSTPDETESSVNVTLLEARRVFGDFGVADRITVIETRWTVDKLSGKVLKGDEKAVARYSKF